MSSMNDHDDNSNDKIKAISNNNADTPCSLLQASICCVTGVKLHERILTQWYLLNARNAQQTWLDLDWNSTLNKDVSIMTLSQHNQQTGV